MKMLIFAFVLIMTTAAVNQQNLQEFTYMNEKLNNMKYTSYKCYESNPNKNTTKSKICNEIVLYSGINVCKKDILYWCHSIVARQHDFDLFEGGVSKMLTMIWLNRICNK